MAINPHFYKQMARTEPGRGATLSDDGETAIVKSRGVPHVATERLQRSITDIHQQVHTPEGLHAWDNPRRGLVENGVKAKMIGHELHLRGVSPHYKCQFCWSQSDD